MITRLAFRNVIKHKWSSLVLAMVFALTTFMVFWIFGFSNNYINDVSENEKYANGDIAIFTENYITKEKASEIVKSSEVKSAVFERRVSALAASRKYSGMLMIDEISDRNIDKLKKVKLDKGRMPEKDDEIVISTEFDEITLDIGDTIYVNTFTPDKVANSVKYKIVGYGKIGEGSGSFITKNAMNILLNSTNYVNTLVVYGKDKATTDEIEKLEKTLREKVESSGIKVEKTTNFARRMKENEAIMMLFKATKILMMIVMFPMIGAVLGALVWIHAFKRRKEIWTYVSLGFKDGAVFRLYITEYMITASAGFAAGIAGGYISSMLSEAGNKMINFTYIMNIVLAAKIGIVDILIIGAFIFGSLILWVRAPIGKIVKEKPFSY